MKKIIKINVELEVDDNITDEEMDDIYDSILSADVIPEQHADKVNSCMILLA